MVTNLEGKRPKLLSGVPAMFYAGLFHAREGGFLKQILEELKITRMTAVVSLEDYPPGAILTIDGDKGDYDVVAIEPGRDVNTIPCDCAVTGRLKPGILLMEHDKNLLFGALGLLLRKQVRIKGLGKLLKLAKLVLRCI